jgi:UPF0716 protein FxsA
MTGTRPGRRRWLLPGLVFAFILVSVAEVWLLSAVGQRIGVLPTLAILIAEAALGAWLMRREGTKAWRALTDAYGTGRMPTGQLADAALVLVGGIMLILPGFFTDVLGLVCLLPWTRPLARRVVGSVIARQAARGGVNPGALRAQYGPGTVIPGETVEEPPAGSDRAQPPPDPRVIRGEVED